MKLRELLQQMQTVQKKIGSSPAYICGGTPRDRFLNQVDKISDVDITTGDKTVQFLAQELTSSLGKQYNIVTKNFDDGHSALHIGNFKMDFSSNFNVENIEAILAKMGIKNPTEMQKEMFSRDFTCNSLLLSLDLRVLLDPTKRGLKDMKEKKIRTCLDPQVTLTTNKNRVIRAVYLSSKLGFDIDESIINFVQKNPGAVKISTPTSLVEKLNDAFKLDADRAAHNITKMGIWGEIPITEEVRPYYLKKTSIATKKAYFQGGGGVNQPTPKKKKYKSDPAIVVQPRFEEPFYRNYDLYDTPGKHSPGAGWHSMQKYKSISEFLEAKRKKMKDKYKADDSWIQDSGEITKKNPGKKARAKLLQQIIKLGIDFPIDEQIESTIDHDGDLSNPSMPIGMGRAPAAYDEEGRGPTSLDFAHQEPESSIPADEDLIDLLTEKYLNHETRTQMNGLPDGFDHSEEEDASITEMNTEYGTLGPESTMYEDKWNI